MSGKLKNKLKSKKGETITETLVSVLIAAAAMILFASMITSSQRILQKSESIMDAYYDGETKMEEAMATGGTADGIKTGTGTVTIKQANDTLPHYGISNKDSSGQIDVTYATNQLDSSDTSTSGIERFAVAEYKSQN